MSGAVDIDECPDIQAVRQLRAAGVPEINLRRIGSLPCRCGRCAVCGNPKHSAIHGPFYGQPPGSEPYGHEYKPQTQEVQS